MLSNKTERHFNNNIRETTHGRSFTCESPHQWNPPRCFCELSAFLASLASCHHRYHQSHFQSLMNGASAWSPHHCHCHWPEPESQKSHILRSCLFFRFSVTLMCNSDIIHNIYSVTRLWVHTIKGDAGKIMEMDKIMQRKCRHKANHSNEHLHQFQLFFSIDATLDQLGGTQWEKHCAKPESWELNLHLTSTPRRGASCFNKLQLNF